MRESTRPIALAILAVMRQTMKGTMSLLKNKIAVVAGGSTGIGLATAKKFVEEVGHVFLAGRRQNEIDKAVVELGKNVTGERRSRLQERSRLRRLDRPNPAVAFERG